VAGIVAIGRIAAPDPMRTSPTRIRLSETNCMISVSGARRGALHRGFGAAGAIFLAASASFGTLSAPGSIARSAAPQPAKCKVAIRIAAKE
jgi:hypothetical protein